MVQLALIKIKLYAVNSLEKKGLSSPAAGLGIIKRILDYEQRKEQFIVEKLKEAAL